MHYLGTRPGPGVAAMAGLLALAACGGADDMPPAPVETLRYSIEEFLESTRYRGGSFSPDNSQVLVGSNETGIFNAFAFPVAGGEPVQLTHSTTDSIRPATYFPSDERFLYVSDEGGNELTHVYVQDPEGGSVSNTPGPFSPDGSSLYYLTDDGGEFVDLTRYDIEHGTREAVLRVDWDVTSARFSKHGKYFVVGINNDARTELRLYDAATMHQIPLPTPTSADVTSVWFSGDESLVAFYASSSDLMLDHG